jgi:hypothetical protein
VGDSALSGLKDLPPRWDQLECVPLSLIIEKYFGSDGVDILHVDGEGYDNQIIRSNDLIKNSPKTIVFEYKDLSDEEKRNI